MPKTACNWCGDDVEAKSRDINAGKALFFHPQCRKASKAKSQEIGNLLATVYRQ